MLQRVGADRRGRWPEKAPNIQEFNKRFPDDDACLTHLMRVRFGERLTCFKCQKQATYYRVTGRRSYVCEHCGYQVYPTAGTPFESTRTPLRDWFFVMFQFTTSRNGVAAKEVQRQLGVTYKTAWRMCNLIRKYMGYVDGDYPLGGPGKTVEIDETFIGGKDRAGHDDKAVVFGIVERDGDVLTRHVAMRTKAHIIPHVVTFVKPGTKIYTDEGSAFKLLTEKYGYEHEAVDHSAQGIRARRRSHEQYRRLLGERETRHQGDLRARFKEAPCRLTFASSSIAITCAGRLI
jgi:transposase